MERILQTIMVLVIATILLLAAREVLIAAETPPVPTVVRGTVVETLAGGGYTYLCLEEEGRLRWAAIPQAEVKVGQKVDLAPGTPMGKFTSKTLGRTFDEIYFSSGVVGAAVDLPHPLPTASAAGGMPPGHGMAGMMGASAAVGDAAEKMVDISGSVAETMDAGGYTYVRVARKGAAPEAKPTWVAIPVTKLAVGDQVTFTPGAAMENFTSKTLKRTFETIIFSGGLRERD